VDLRLRIPIFGYVDDFVLLATSASDLQCLMSEVADWCEVFNMVVICAKTRLTVFAGLGRHAQKTSAPLMLRFGVNLCR
jgi:hypothetical protein